MSTFYLHHSHLVCYNNIIQWRGLANKPTGKHFWYWARSSKLFILLQGTYPVTISIRELWVLITYQIGACRHGDRCSRKHIRPPFSQIILLPNVYHNPAHDPICKLTEKDLQEGFDAVYEDLYCELAKFGHLMELHVSLMSSSVSWPFNIMVTRFVITLEIT